MWLYVILACVLLILWWLVSYLRSKQIIKDLHNRAVFITGCDSGFGKALALHLDSLGVPVFAGCLTQKGQTGLSEMCSSRLVTISLDVTSSESITKAMDKVQHSLKKSGVAKKLWGVVNNAGIIGDFGTTEMYSRQDFQKVMDVNFLGQVDVIQTFLPLLKQSKGRIVNIASISGVYPYATLNFPSPYTPSKYAVVGYTDALRYDLKRWGIEVSLLIPGGHNTDIVSIDGQLHRFREMWEGLSDNVRTEYGQQWIDEVCSKYSKLDSLIKGLPGVEPVVEAYTHALIAKHPQQRYLVGADAKVMNIIKLFPQCLIDRLVNGPLNMMPLPLPAVLHESSASMCKPETLKSAEYTKSVLLKNEEEMCARSI